ncbi:MAG: hypothetical protein D6776_08195 [Planctomycetota bacterium]|nr:MAG: hypothetical protein D6776_08195 [Planctomycetota bacterium]
MARRRRARPKRPRKGRGREPDAYRADAERLAREFVDTVAQRWGARLGDDLDAVRVLDRVLEYVRDENAEELLLPAGFYFGELLRRAYGGHYAWSPLRKALGLRFRGLVLYPLETVRRRVEQPGARPLEHVLLVLAKQLSERDDSPP